MRLKIPLSFPVFTGNENLYTQQAIASGSLATSGRFIEEFESRLNQNLETHGTLALNSGTSALHLAMILMGIGLGDEVICQSFTFCATANPIVYLGASPIFVDSEQDTWNLCPDLLEDTILSRISLGIKPKAIIVVHLFGMPAKMKEIMEISEKYDIPVLEDAAEAVGSFYNGEACGTLGQFAVYSFNGNKIITGGGGGALISKDTAILQRAKHLATQALETAHFYYHKNIGYNYRMNNLVAAVALAQFEQLDLFVAQRRMINQNYREMLEHIPGISFQNESVESRSNFWLSAILIDQELAGFSNEDLRISLLDQGIETRLLWKPLHTQPVFKNAVYYGGQVATSLFSKGLCLPSSANLSLQEQQTIVQVICNLSVKALG